MENCEERIFYAVECKAEMRLLSSIYQSVDSLLLKRCLFHLRATFIREHSHPFHSLFTYFDRHHKQDRRVASLWLLQGRATPCLGTRLGVTHPQAIKPLRFHDSSFLFTEI